MSCVWKVGPLNLLYLIVYLCVSVSVCASVCVCVFAGAGYSPLTRQESHDSSRMWTEFGAEKTHFYKRELPCRIGLKSVLAHFSSWHSSWPRFYRPENGLCYLTELAVKWAHICSETRTRCGAVDWSQGFELPQQTHLGASEHFYWHIGAAQYQSVYRSNIEMHSIQFKSLQQFVVSDSMSDSGIKFILRRKDKNTIDNVINVCFFVFDCGIFAWKFD